jgi:uncharacterized peroxidase-related enzyme
MARLPLLEYHQLTDEKAKLVYDQIKGELGFGIVPNLFKSMGSNPAFLETSWNKFRDTILKGELPRTLKEMIGVAISQANKSEYALRVHLHGLSALGMSEEVLRTLIADFEACPLPVREKAAIRFGLLAGTRPLELKDTHFDELRKQGIDDAEIFEIIATANLFAGVNQYTDAIALEIDAL